jgi:hypothetical protein
MEASYIAKLKKAYSVQHYATFTALVDRAKGAQRGQQAA